MYLRIEAGVVYTLKKHFQFVHIHLPCRPWRLVLRPINLDQLMAMKMVDLDGFQPIYGNFHAENA